MTQLVLDVAGQGLALPESIKGTYTVDEEELSQSLVMIAGNMVKELNGKVWVITYQHGYFNTADKDRFIAACKKGSAQPIICTFLVPDTNQTLQSEFFVTSYTRPKFMWSRSVQDGESTTVEPLWGDFSVELREVDPHD